MEELSSRWEIDIHLKFLFTESARILHSLECALWDIFVIKFSLSRPLLVTWSSYFAQESCYHHRIWPLSAYRMIFQSVRPAVLIGMLELCYFKIAFLASPWLHCGDKAVLPERRLSFLLIAYAHSVYSPLTLIAWLCTRCIFGMRWS